MLRAGIIGGGGYTAGELIRLLRFHPEAEIGYVHSNSQTGKPISSIHQDLAGEMDLVFTNALDYEVDVLFLCMGHGQSAAFFSQNTIPDSVCLIDLSHDFRLDPEFVYGLPELNGEVLRGAKRIANPGCFATAIQLALLPLAAEGLLRQAVHIHAVTGSTGAGQSPSPTTHFSWRNNNLSIYKAFRHQHLAEIRASLSQLQKGFDQPLHFLPLRGDFPRGIFASAYTEVDLTEGQLQELYQGFYAHAPFTIASRENPHLKQVVNTNKALVHIERHEDQALVISCIDNLLKGASGQAVENMNLAFELDPWAGLQLKALAF